MNKVLVGVVVALILGAGVYYFSRTRGSTPALPKPQTQTQQQPSQKDQFSNPKKSAHYEGNTPEHGATLAGVPLNVVIDFNFDLAQGSKIEIVMGRKDYGIGETVVDKNKLAMRRKMDASSPDGLYTVSYKACWADGTCHDGQFQFKIDRSLANGFVDMTGQKEVTINLQNTAFSPARVKISKGTKVTWRNLDGVVHTVNTDSHPGHTYYLNQNSENLSKGDSYSVTFSDAGVYPYHCTPHASIMRGQILVE